MTTKFSAVLTDREGIIDALTGVEVGDELTVQHEAGYRDNREVYDTSEQTITFGDPANPDTCKILHKGRGTVHSYFDSPQKDITDSGWNITRLWVW